MSTVFESSKLSLWFEFVFFLSADGTSIYIKDPAGVATGKYPLKKELGREMLFIDQVPLPGPKPVVSRVQVNFSDGVTGLPKSETA